jgi:predicted nucleic acid-binding Zn ribbon protein
MTRDETTYTRIDLEANAWECSACDCAWQLMEGSPEDNNMRFCPECGAKITKIVVEVS